MMIDMTMLAMGAYALMLFIVCWALGPGHTMTHIRGYPPALKGAWGAPMPCMP